MKKFHIIFLILISAGCRTEKIRKQIHIPRAVSGTHIPLEEFHRVRYGENIKTFTLGRYIDPHNPDIMHERSVIYRIEEGPAWNTLPAKPFSLPYDRRVQYTDISPEHQAAELELGLRAQKKLVKGMQKLTVSSAESFKTLLKENIKLTNEIILLKKDLDALKSRIRTEEKAEKNKEVHNKKRAGKINDISSF